PRSRADGPRAPAAAADSAGPPRRGRLVVPPRRRRPGRALARPAPRPRRRLRPPPRPERAGASAGGPDPPRAAAPPHDRPRPRPGPGRHRRRTGPRPGRPAARPGALRAPPRRPRRRGLPAALPADRPQSPAPLSRRARPARGEAPMTTTPALSTTALSTTAATDAARRVLDAVETAVVGKRQSLELVLTGLLAGGHVLLEDLPGLGKTLAARSFAQALGLPFARAQFTPDLLPADLTGAEVFDQRTGEFVFRPGPVFTGLLLADEINRTPPKTQSALLEAMQERQVSVEGTTRPLPVPFHVLATANPIEHEGTYPLPEAQLDRFLLRLSFGYPSAEQEWEVVSRRIDRRREEQTVAQVLDAEQLLALQAAVEEVHVEDAVGRYAVDLVAATRRHQNALV